MRSSNRQTVRPGHRRAVARRDAAVLTTRDITVVPGRREQPDFHYLARALLRLAQEEYEAQKLPPRHKPDTTDSS